LKNGEDIISEVNETELGYVLHNPCKIMYLTSGKPGYLSISLMQWVFSRICAQQEFEIPKSEVLFMSPPSEMLSSHYEDSIIHFSSKEDKQKLEFDSIMTDDDLGMEDDENAMDMLKELLERINKPDKGKLH
jgi:hypothetical protein